MTLLLRCHLLPRSPFLSVIAASRRTSLRLLTTPSLPLAPHFVVTASIRAHATSSLPAVAVLPLPSILPSTSLQYDDEVRTNSDEDDDGSFPPTPLHVPLEKLFIPPEVDLSVADPSNFRILKGSNIVLSHYAKDSIVSQAEFVKSSTRQEDCPSDGRPEFALVGRSNVGKSSLLNSIVRRKQLALTSKKPGKTQCINHFLINNSWYLVDLPGYGYASAPQQARSNWNEFTRKYFRNRSTLVSVFLLIDASIPAKPIDLEYARWLGEHQIPMTLAFTKCDKRKKRKNGGKRPEENVEDFLVLISEFFQQPPPWIMTSSITNVGRDEMLLHIAQLRNYWQKH